MLKLTNEERIVTKEINGGEVKFHPLPMSILFECNRLGEAVSSLVANLFADTSHDAEQEETTIPVKLEDSDTPYQNWNRSTKAISPSMATLRVGQKKEGINSLINALTDHNAKKLLAEIVCKSLKEEKITPEELAECDAETFVELFQGVQEANKGVFEKLGKWLRLLAPEKLAERAKEKVEEALSTSRSSNEN